jgi:hypothetical protein
VKTITTKTTKDRINAANTGSTSPYTVAPRIPANAGPTIKPRLEDIAIFPKFLLLSSSEEMSATYASATETFPPVSPSIALARNSATKGRVIAKVPIIVESMLNRLLTGKNNAIRKIIHPASVPP